MKKTQCLQTMRLVFLRGQRVMLRLSLGMVAVALVGCASLDKWARSKVYRPTPVSDAADWQSLLDSRADVHAFSVPVGVTGEQVTVLEVAAQPGQTSPVRVLYLHGTFQHAFQNLPKAASMLRAGMDVLLPDYRGWGRSSPRLPNEASIHADAWAVWQALQADARDTGQSPVRWVIYGHSMGSAVAVKLAARLKGQGRYCALVLESAFTNFSDVADAAAGWWRLVSNAWTLHSTSVMWPRRCGCCMGKPTKRCRLAWDAACLNWRLSPSTGPNGR